VAGKETKIMIKANLTHSKSTKSDERTRTSYLMSKDTDELSKDPKWHKFVQECILEHGYAWQYNFNNDKRPSKRRAIFYKDLV